MVFHVSLFQPYSEGGTTLGPPDPIVTAGEEEEYEVESILMALPVAGCSAMEYLVDWYSYDEEEDS